MTDFQIDDTIMLKKVHPCGSFEWKVTRLGADIGLKCCRCGRYILLARSKLERQMKKGGKPSHEKQPLQRPQDTLMTE